MNWIIMFIIVDLYQDIMPSRLLLKLAPSDSSSPGSSSSPAEINNNKEDSKSKDNQEAKESEKLPEQNGPPRDSESAGNKTETGPKGDPLYVQR